MMQLKFEADSIVWLDTMFIRNFYQLFEGVSFL